MEGISLLKLVFIPKNRHSGYALLMKVSMKVARAYMNECGTIFRPGISIPSIIMGLRSILTTQGWAKS